MYVAMIIYFFIENYIQFVLASPRKYFGHVSLYICICFLIELIICVKKKKNKVNILKIMKKQLIYNIFLVRKIL